MAEHTNTVSMGHAHTCTHAHKHTFPNYPGQWLPVGEANCLFPLPRADTEPSGCALKIDQLCVPVLSPLATAYLHKSLFWECHPARVKRGERLILEKFGVAPCGQTSQCLCLDNCDLCPAFSNIR